MSGFFLDDIEIGDKSQRAVNAINDIIGCLRPAENYINQICEKINQIGLSNIRFDSQKRFYDDMEEAASKISAYNRITQEYDNDVDRKFSDKYSDVVSELSRIKVKDITIKNNLGITEIRNTNGYRYPVEKVEITLEDLLSYGEFGDIIKESYEGYCERVELSDEEDIYTFDKYVEAISEIGEFEDPKILERKRKISTLLDCVPFVGFGKVLIEVISGENLITHEKLSFLQRIIAGVSLIPIGAIAKWLKGVFKGGINSLLRRVGKSAITDIGEEVTEAVIKDEVRGLEKNIASEVADDVVRETVEEIGEIEGREVVESRIKTNFANEIPRSSEEWNEYFIGKYGADNVERVIKEEVSKAADINSIKTMLTTGNLDDVYKYIKNSSLKSINNDSIDIIFKNIDKDISNTVENISLKKTIVEKALKDGAKIDTLVPASIDFLDETSGWIKWPPNDGFILELEKGNRPIKTLEVGEVIDRFGRETGNYVSPKYPTVTYEERALPYLENPNAYHQYEILKPIPGVEYGEIAEAFGQSGGGVQYILPESLKYYLDNGFIREIFK